MQGVRIAEIIRNEKECVERQGLPFGCDRKCGECDLVLETEEIKAAYTEVLRRVEPQEPNTSYSGETYFCPSCSMGVSYYENFCKNCGKALKWPGKE